MELLWCLITAGPPFLIAVGGYRLLSKKMGLPSPVSGLLCGTGAGLYLYALGAFAFSHSVTAWAPGLMFHVHTFLGAMLFAVLDTILGTPLVGASSGWHFASSYTALLLIQGGVSVIAYGLLGLFVGIIARRGSR